MARRSRLCRIPRPPQLPPRTALPARLSPLPPQLRAPHLCSTLHHRLPPRLPLSGSPPLPRPLLHLLLTLLLRRRCLLIPRRSAGLSRKRGCCENHQSSCQNPRTPLAHFRLRAGHGGAAKRLPMKHATIQKVSCSAGRCPAARRVLHHAFAAVDLYSLGPSASTSC